MFLKITHLPSEVLPVYYEFVKAVRTSTWISGIELGDKNYDAKPIDGSRREVIIWQGPKNGLHQKVTFKLIYSGDHGWCHQGLVFSGINAEGEWSQAFSYRQDHDGNWHFAPCIMESGWYPKEYEDSEFDKLFTKWLCRS